MMFCKDFELYYHLQAWSIICSKQGPPALSIIHAAEFYIYILSVVFIHRIIADWFHWFSQYTLSQGWS